MKLKPTKLNQKDAVWGLLFVSVPVLSVILFVFLPALFSIYISLVEWNGFIPIEQAQFVGFKNFAALDVYKRQALDDPFLGLFAGQAQGAQLQKLLARDLANGGLVDQGRVHMVCLQARLRQHSAVLGQNGVALGVAGAGRVALDGGGELLPGIAARHARCV